MRLTLSVFISIILTSLSFGQTKNEKETRIKFLDLPEAIQSVVKDLPEQCRRIKFYRETDGNKQSYEVKFKYKKKRYSLEFSTDGTIEDIELATKLRRIDEDAKKQIAHYFNDHFEKNKIIKIQAQYVFKNEKTASQFIYNVLSEKDDLFPNYEIIAEVRQKKNRDVREFLFDNEGHFLSFRILNPTSYEHILY